MSPPGNISGYSLAIASRALSNELERTRAGRGEIETKF